MRMIVTRMETGQSTSGADRPPRRPTFGLRRMMLIMVLFCVMAAMFGGLLRGGADRQLWVMLGAAAPLALMLFLGLVDQLRRWQQRPSKRDR